MDYVRTAMERTSSGRQKPTLPMVLGGGDFVLARVQPEAPAGK